MSYLFTIFTIELNCMYKQCYLVRIVMRTSEISFLEWQKLFQTDEDCLNYLKSQRWPDGFVCPHCWHHKGCQLKCREHIQCNNCRKQVSVTSGTLFHSTNLPLSKWFLAIYFVGSDKGSISTLRLSKLIDVNWKKAK